MKNTYMIVGLLVILGIIIFVFSTKKSEAPVKVVDEQKEVATSSTPLVMGSYTIDTSASSIGWKAEKVIGMTEEGTVHLSGGSVTLGDTVSNGTFTMDMNTIESIPHKDMLVTHLKSDDFFAVKTYPTATFVLKSMAPSSAEGKVVGRYIVGGDLTVKGITKPISFIATVTSEGNTVHAVGSFALNRADWQIKYGSTSFFKDLGDKAIRDSMTLTLDLKGTKVIQ